MFFRYWFYAMLHSNSHQLFENGCRRMGIKIKCLLRDREGERKKEKIVLYTFCLFAGSFNSGSTLYGWIQNILFSCCKVYVGKWKGSSWDPELIGFIWLFNTSEPVHGLKRHSVWTHFWEPYILSKRIGIDHLKIQKDHVNTCKPFFYPFVLTLETVPIDQKWWFCVLVGRETKKCVEPKCNQHVADDTIKYIIFMKYVTDWLPSTNTFLGNLLLSLYNHSNTWCVSCDMLHSFYYQSSETP